MRTSAINSAKNTAVTLKNVAQSPQGQAALYNGGWNASISCYYNQSNCDSKNMLYNFGIGTVAGTVASPSGKQTFEMLKQGTIYGLGSYGSDMINGNQFNHSNAGNSAISGAIGAGIANGVVRSAPETNSRNFTEAYISAFFSNEINQSLGNITNKPNISNNPFNTEKDKK